MDGRTIDKVLATRIALPAEGDTEEAPTGI